MIFPLSLPPALALALALAQFPPSSRDRDPREAGFVPPFAPPVRSQPGSDHRPTTRPPPPLPPVPVPVPRFHSRRRDRSQLQTALPAVFNLGQPAKNVITFFPRTVEHYARPRAVPDASRPEYSLHGFAAAAAPPPRHPYPEIGELRPRTLLGRARITTGRYVNANPAPGIAQIS